MQKILFSIITIVALTLSGCAGNLSPLSPRMDQKLNNQNGKIDELKNNQQGFMLELGKIRQQQELSARDTENLQQGMLNFRGNDNSGVQILSGDVGLLGILAITIMSTVLIFHYRTRALKSEKSAAIFAQQVAMHNNRELDNKVLMAAMNSDVESDVYHLMVKSQALTGRRKA